MDSIGCPQVLLARSDRGEVRWLAESPGLAEEVRPALEDLCKRFGERPVGARCPRAVFARPLGRKQVVIAIAADLGIDSSGAPTSMGFHFVLLPLRVYEAHGGDPFYLAQNVPPVWDRRGALPLVELPGPKRRTVEDVCASLKREDGPTLLGATQGLVDGSAVAWIRPYDDAIVPSLWQLLPTRARTELWPASFAFSNQLRFDAVVLPEPDKENLTRRYLSEEQAANYPEGRYELSVQSAAEAGDQAWLDEVLSRRGRRDTWRMGILLIMGIVILYAALSLMRALGR